MTFKTILALVMVTVLPFINPAQQGQDYSYTIGPKDLLKINVFNVPELNITVRVSEDGTVTLPLLGNIQVSGLTRFRLEQKLVTLLEKKYLKNPQVTVFIQEHQSKKISIMGAVQKPGDYELIGKKTLLQLISMAGGLTENAESDIVIIRQYANGKSSSLKINLNDLMIKGNPKLNIPLQAGDIINVPHEQFIDVYILGKVKNPGRVRLKKGTSVTLLRAIAQAGGFAERARKSSILVTRRTNGKEKKIRVNAGKILRGQSPDFILQHNDMVHVPESIL